MEDIFFDNWEGLQRTTIIGILAYISVISMLRLFGSRTLSQMKEFDFIVTVALGSLLASMLLDKDISLVHGVLAIGILILLQYIFSMISVRSKTFTKIITNEPIVIFYEGRFIKEAMLKEKITEGDVRSVLRKHGIGKLSEVSAVVLEPNGEFSVVQDGSVSDPESSLYEVQHIESNSQS